MMTGSTPPLERRLAHVTPPAAYDADQIRAIRRALNVSQGVFADLLNVSLGTVQAWEQGRRVPDGAAVRLLEIAERYPKTILTAMSLSRPQITA
jgi:putative transcriptional regulator